MYEEFYGLTRRPFENTPNPEFFFASKQHREGLAALIYGIKQCKGFMLVTGEVGSGKTFLTQSLKYELEEENHIILEVATPWITPEELFAELPEKLGMDMDPEWGSLVFQSKLKEQLERLHEEGRRVLVILDEAQQLPERTLEGIRLLSNFETEDAKLIQIIFLGQNELNDILGRYSMRQIRQRITLSRSLGYFNEIETRRYIEHRLNVSGCSRRIFDDNSLSLIFRKSHGSPRLINLICDNALITGYAQFAQVIDARIVNEVVEDLPPVHHDATYDYDKAPPSEGEKAPLQVVAPPPPEQPQPVVPSLKVAAPMPPAAKQPLQSVAEPESYSALPEMHNEPESGAEKSMSQRLTESLESDDYDDDYYPGEKRKGPFARIGLWIVLVITIVASWYGARWYENRNRDTAPAQSAIPEQTAPVVAPSVVAAPAAPPEISVETKPSLPMSEKALTWDDDPQMNNGSVAAEAHPMPVAPSIPVTPPAAVEQTDQQKPTVVRMPDKSTEGLSLFERLRIEANVADVRSQVVEPVAEEAQTAADDSMKVQTSVQALPPKNVVKQTPSRQPQLAADGRAEVGFPEGIVTSARAPARYESGKKIPYPFDRLVDQLDQKVRLRKGETVSQLARRKYTTWNDSVQDMVRALNPPLQKNMDIVTTRYINLPDVQREYLATQTGDGRWYVFLGTVTSRLKANSLYDAVKALGEPTDMVVTRNNQRRIYRVYMGPYNTKATALQHFGKVSLTHMPYVKN